MPKIFISYSSHDHGHPTAELLQRLRTHFGADSLALESDDIPRDLDSRMYIDALFPGYNLLVIIVGENCLKGASEESRRRLNQICIEIEAAPAHKIVVVPVLLEDAPAPTKANLIVELKEPFVRFGTHLGNNAERLIKLLEGLSRDEPRVADDALLYSAIRSGNWGPLLLSWVREWKLVLKIWADAPPSSRIAYCLDLPQRREDNSKSRLGQSRLKSVGRPDSASRAKDHDELKRLLQHKLIDRLDLSRVKDLTTDMLRRDIRRLVEHVCDLENLLLNRRECEKLIEEVVNDMLPPSKPETDAPDAVNHVDCAVFAPAKVNPGEGILIQVFGYPFGKDEEARQQALEFDDQTARRGFTTLEVAPQKGQHIQFHLELHKINVEMPVRNLVWLGRPGSVQYEVTIPGDYSPGSILGSVIISIDGLPVGRIGFKLTVVGDKPSAKPDAQAPIAKGIQKFHKAFVSYSSDDRAAVLARIQLLRPPIHQIEVFQDLLSLTPGERWEQQLYKRIDECDLFLLFWSTKASQSEWVQREWQYALRRQGPSNEQPPIIFPVIIEGPPPPKPPPELSHLHFNDYLLYFNGAATALSK